jgi:hypothetical protein
MNVSAATKPPGWIVTFYSFKGGVGRSMSLANVAALLSIWGQRVLIVDWDLEAPGIEGFFKPWLSGLAQEVPGVVDLVCAYFKDEDLHWTKCLLHANPPAGKPIAIISSGRADETYGERLRSIDWEKLFKERRFGNFLEKLRREWISEYDFVLLDSRTGITDIGGICTIHLPDALVAMFITNEQNLQGVKKVLASARHGHSTLPVDRRRLLVVPIPSRDETDHENVLAEQWRKKFATELGDFLDDWVPKDVLGTTVLNYLKIPYKAFWSFGERVPVLEQPDPDNPKELAYAYQPLAKLLLTQFNWKEARDGARASEEAQKQALEAERLRLETARLAEQAEVRLAQQRKNEKATQDLQDRINNFLAGPYQKYYGEVLKQIAYDSFVVMAINICKFGTLLMTSVFVVLEFSNSGNINRVWLSVSVVLLSLSVIGDSLSARRDRVHAFQALRAKLRSEREAFESGTGPYSSVPKDRAFTNFADAVSGATKSLTVKPLLSMSATEFSKTTSNAKDKAGASQEKRSRGAGK